MKKKGLTKKEMAKKYCVSYNTFICWIKNIPELKLFERQRVLTPRQIEIITDALGEP